ncbi:hypothetical protein [Selenomonas bovis]|uniref:hypothetical protein n=1 Tax=Selenomonas bovis TaxID=416586 RepID=UPI0012DCEE60|nr:hypothetical protein [Selenomonas bovis]
MLFFKRLTGLTPVSNLKECIVHGDDADRDVLGMVVNALISAAVSTVVSLLTISALTIAQ